MSQKIKRGGTSVRKAAAAQGRSKQVRAAKAKTGSALDGVLSFLGLGERELHRIFLVAILGGAVALAWVVASYAGVPDMARAQIATVASDTGFEVRRVDVRGVRQLNELKVYERVLSERERAMPLVDLDQLRARLMELSWVEDARVSRQLPDTLVVDIVERKPVAVLRKPDRLVLIDGEGRELEAISAARADGKLVVSGPGAGKQMVQLGHLLDAAPALRPQVAGAEWVGNRRWNLTFRTDQVLALPQGDQAAANALTTFARLDGVNRLLGGKVAAFDMRAPDRIYLRVPGRANAASLPAVAPAPAEAASPASSEAETN